MLTDTHCHLDFKNYDKDRNLVLKRAWETGLIRILNPGVDIDTSNQAIKIAEKNPKIFAAVGIHPNSSVSWNSQSRMLLEKLAGNPKVAAIGEIGLDYYRDRAPKDHQQLIFSKQLELAVGLDKPVVIHTRNASMEDRSCISDTIEILSRWQSDRVYPGVVHSYSGDSYEAEVLISQGFMLGITGPITYKNASSFREVVGSIPLDHLLIETDGPFLSPHPYRGKRNEPAYVRYIAEKIGEIHRVPFNIVVEQTSRNADRLFGWGNSE